MIIANIKDAKRYEPLCKEFAKAFEFLKTLNEDTPVGKFEGDGFRGSVAVFVTSDTAKDGTEKLIEAHRDYLDIHYCISGSEGIGYADIDTLTPATEYNAEKDYQLLKGEMFKAILNPGDFCIVFPEDAHAPSMIGKGGTDLKKAVIKIKL